MFSPRFAPILFGFFMSLLMVSVLVAIQVLRLYGLTPNFLALWWEGAYITWPIAFPVVLVVAPLVRKIVVWLTTPRQKTESSEP